MTVVTRAQTEAELERQVKKLFRLYGWLYYHTHRSQFSPSGFPDIHAISTEQNRIIYAELKRSPKEELRPDQVVYRDALLAVGEEWYRIDWSTPLELVARVLQHRPDGVAGPALTSVERGLLGLPERSME